MPCDYSKYPKDWPQIRERILKRDGRRCQGCGIYHHAVGYRDESGEFVRNGGNGPCDASGYGATWPAWNPLSYAEAKEYCEAYNCCGARDDRDNHWFVVVLTIAHLDHDTTNNDESNLKALCQKCHLQYDAKFHAENAKATRDRKRGLSDMFAGLAAPIEGGK
jgi:hypothetical protein